MNEKIVHVDGIGDIKLKKNKRSKAVSISIRPHKGITVNMPFYFPFGEALKIVEMRRDWFMKNLPRVKQIENKKTIFTEISEFKTRTRVLNILSHPGEKFIAQLTNDKIILNYPSSNIITEPTIQNLIRKAIQWALKAEAKEYLPSRVQFFSQSLNLKYNKLFLKNNKTNWGSCSAKNNINLNIHLVRLPDHLIDYVIIHELCHTLEKNHGPRFWQLLGTFLPYPKQLSKELKAYSTQTY